jgi:hypothetical protein
MLFEFHVEDRPPFQSEHSSMSAARSKAGKLARRYDCPVDVANGGDAPFPDRYITTAMPSEFRETGFRFSRRRM